MNVILVLADQLSAKWLGCYGNAGASTPHLDRLAAVGTRFANACANHPVCMPSRSTLFTGRSARHHGVLYNGYELSPEMPTFARELQHAGVQTLGVGKYHLECHGRNAYNDVRKYGFDRAETTEDIRAGDWLDWVRKTWPQHYDQALATVWSMPHLSSYGRERRDLLAEVAEARRRHPPRTVTRLTYPSLVPEEACQTRWVMDRGLAFLEERDRQRPFFLYLSFVDPHDPYDPPARFLDRIVPERIPTPVCRVACRLRGAAYAGSVVTARATSDGRMRRSSRPGGAMGTPPCRSGRARCVPALPP